MKRSPMKRQVHLKRAGPPTATVKAFKPKVCSKAKGGCGEKFTPTRQMQAACGHLCAMAFVVKANAKKARKAAADERRETKAQIMAAKPRRYWLGKAEAAINRYVRARDFFDGCISCHLPSHWDGQWHASHFRSAGAASSVRFNLWNIHKSCSACNLHQSGNIAAYRPRIIAKIGQAKVDWLSTQNQRAEYPSQYLQRLAIVFNKKARRREKRNALRCGA